MILPPEENAPGMLTVHRNPSFELDRLEQDLRGALGLDLENHWNWMDIGRTTYTEFVINARFTGLLPEC